MFQRCGEAPHDAILVPVAQAIQFHRVDEVAVLLHELFHAQCVTCCADLVADPTSGG